MTENRGQPADQPRCAEQSRRTRETDLRVTLNIDGTGQADINTGIGFLDHLLTALAHHARFDLTLAGTGDLEIDDHHTAEDAALLIGSVLNEALDDRRSIERFGSAHAPLDESLARAVVDLSGRPCAVVNLGLTRERIGSLATENITHALQSIAMASRTAIHVDVLRGENDHHRAEAAFKALALALRQAVQRNDTGRVASTKGSLS